MPRCIFRLLGITLLITCNDSQRLVAAPVEKSDFQTILQMSSSTPLHGELARKILSQAYDHLGIPFEVTYLPHSRSLRSSNSGNKDGELYRIDQITKLYPNLTKVPVELFSVKLVVAVSGHPELTNIDQLTELRVGTIGGAVLVEDFLNEYGFTNVLRVNNGERLPHLLKAEKIDAVITSHLFAEEHKAHYPDLDIRVLHTIKETPVYHYLHNKHTPLIPQLAQVLSEMRNSGQINALQKQHTEQIVKEALVAD